MSAEIVNLRRARKARDRTQKEAGAAENRSAFGVSTRQKKLRAARDEIERKRHQAHRLSPDDDPAS
jgi:hypothetical protein